MKSFKQYDYSLLDNIYQLEEHNKEFQVDFRNGYDNLIVEIGCGNGHFLTDIAEKNLNNIFIGIDIKKERLIRSVEKKNKRGIKNINFIHGDAKIVIDVFFENESITQFFMTFPDPWPKKRHHKKRLFKEDFISIVYNKLKIGGRFLFITDFQNYYEESKEIIANDCRFLILENDIEGELFTSSIFGDRWKKDGREFFIFEFVKK